MSDRTHFVYEAYDADGLLLYVGCTGKPGDRFKAHMSGTQDARGWFHPFVTHWRVSGPYPKTTAFALERKRIADMRPIWNGHNPENKDRALIAEYLAFHGVRFQPSPLRSIRPDLVPAKRRRLRVVASA